MSRKALFFDIDGTLLSEFDGGIPESAKEALKEALFYDLFFLAFQEDVLGGIFLCQCQAKLLQYCVPFCKGTHSLCI